MSNRISDFLKNQLGSKNYNNKKARLQTLSGQVTRRKKYVKTYGKGKPNIFKF